ncbi:hypothetical protein GCK72_019433 [Caenorhabditis remanei]|uniref:Uncharacterized protein n=1 Tax=Caenorhabditis remanei TaxID=31234 RepID=A0A6A5GCL8_CAERE|nr:hypothetical protein GCK72_019433 [Caenorhabditis remanei]KAF1752878.1 hypothetical protein GCK72_019433 [Caenorhabditis remanei]
MLGQLIDGARRIWRRMSSSSDTPKYKLSEGMEATEYFHLRELAEEHQRMQEGKSKKGFRLMEIRCSPEVIDANEIVDFENWEKYEHRRRASFNRGDSPLVHQSKMADRDRERKKNEPNKDKEEGKEEQEEDDDFRPIQRDREKPDESLVTRKLMEALAKKRRDERKRKMDEDETMEVDKPSTSGPQNTREGSSNPKRGKKDDSPPPDDSGPGPSQVDPKWKYRGKQDSSDDEDDATSVKQTSARDESLLDKFKRNLEKVREWWRDVQILPFLRSTAECSGETTTHTYKPFGSDYATSSAPPSPAPSRPPSSAQSKGSSIKRSGSESSLDSELHSARDESSDDEEQKFAYASPNY